MADYLEILPEQDLDGGSEMAKIGPRIGFHRKYAAYFKILSEQALNAIIGDGNLP